MLNGFFACQTITGDDSGGMNLVFDQIVGSLKELRRDDDDGGGTVTHFLVLLLS